MCRGHRFFSLLALIMALSLQVSAKSSLTVKGGLPSMLNPRIAALGKVPGSSLVLKHTAHATSWFDSSTRQIAGTTQGKVVGAAAAVGCAVKLQSGGLLRTLRFWSMSLPILVVSLSCLQ